MAGQRDNNEKPDTVAPLLVVAGVPEAIIQAVIDTVEKRHRPWRVVCRAFPKQDGDVYQDASIVELMRATFEFAKNHRSVDGERVPEPNRVVLAYVDDANAGRLLDAFGHSVLPFKMADDQWEWPKGKHWRNHLETVLALLERALQMAASHPAQALHLRLKQRRPDDAMLLPARNFHLKDGRLADQYRAWLIDPPDPTTVEAVVESRRYPFEKLEEFYKQTGGRNKAFAFDARGLVFAKSEHGQHGFVWDLPQGVVLESAMLRPLLESLFRFGTPIPEGFQHDVQWTDGKALNDEMFDCAQNGPKPFSGSHANVYPNDVVREA